MTDSLPLEGSRERLDEVRDDLEEPSLTRRKFLTAGTSSLGNDERATTNSYKDPLFLTTLALLSVPVGIAVVMEYITTEIEFDFQDYDGFPLDSVKLVGLDDIGYEETKSDVGETASFDIYQLGQYQLRIEGGGELYYETLSLEKDKNKYKVDLSEF